MLEALEMLEDTGKLLDSIPAEIILLLKETMKCS